MLTNYNLRCILETFVSLRMILQPFVEISLLCRTHLNAVTNAVDSFGERAFGGLDLVCSEEVNHLVPMLYRAERSRSTYYAGAR